MTGRGGQEVLYIVDPSTHTTRQVLIPGTKIKDGKEEGGEEEGRRKVVRVREERIWGE